MKAFAIALLAGAAALSAGSVYPFTLGSLLPDTPFACGGSALFVDSAGALCYVDGAAAMPSDAEVKRMRPA